MKISTIRHFLLWVVLLTLTLAAPCRAQPLQLSKTLDHSKLHLYLSNFTHHYTANENHKTVQTVGLEREFDDGKIDGLALFTNSFGQPSMYLYPWGKVYKNIGGINHVFVKWTAGLLYGYVEPYENKVPFNYRGFSPGAILALGYEFKPGWSAQINALGTAAMMIQLNISLN